MTPQTPSGRAANPHRRRTPCCSIEAHRWLVEHDGYDDATEQVLDALEAAVNKLPDASFGPYGGSYVPGHINKSAVAATATTLADFCPDRHEHTPPGGKGYVATVHPACGLAVVYVRKPRRG